MAGLVRSFTTKKLERLRKQSRILRITAVPGNQTPSWGSDEDCVDAITIKKS